MIYDESSVQRDGCDSYRGVRAIFSVSCTQDIESLLAFRIRFD